jgi:protein TonB
MELKKTPKADLENKRNIFVQFGLVISLGIVLTAFNINDRVKTVDTLGELMETEIEEEVIPITRQEEVKPPPPPPPPKVVEVLTIVDDDVELEEEFVFESLDDDEDLIIDAMPVIEEENEEEANEVFVIVEEMPQFPGGDLALRQWIASNIKYPVIAAENGIQGRVFVQFVVNTDGSITDVRVARGVDPSLDQEAIRVVKTLPKWKPGKQRGKPVRVSYTVPINFQLQ